MTTPEPRWCVTQPQTIPARVSGSAAAAKQNCVLAPAIVYGPCGPKPRSFAAGAPASSRPASGVTFATVTGLPVAFRTAPPAKRNGHPS